jgi:LPS-assembly lipoprotein
LGVQKTSLVTRANLVVTAGISLVSLGGGEALYTATDQVSVSYNILNSEFATLMAEKDARNRAINALSENIRIRLGAYFERLETERKGLAP